MDQQDQQIVEMISQAMQILDQARQMMATEDQGENEGPEQAAPTGKKQSLLARGK